MNPAQEFETDCARFVARTALAASESMNTDQRLMIQQGIMRLFPKDSAEWSHANATADALTEFKSRQLRLFESLES